MTKSIRVENADTSQHKVLIKVMQKDTANPDKPHVVVNTINLDHPTQMQTLTIFKQQYLVIEEVE